MKRLSRPVAALAALVVVSVACSACNLHVLPYAAVVNGSTVSQSTLNDTMSAIAHNGLYTCQLTDGSTSVRIEGAGKNTYASSFASDVLSILIEQQAVANQVARLGLAVPSDVATAARTQVIDGLGAGQSETCPAAGDTIFAAFPPDYQDRLVEFQSNEDAIAAHLAGASLDPAGLAAYAEAHPGLAQQACISVIVSKTEHASKALHDELAKGADFAELAKKHSVDAATAAKGGSVGCAMSFEFAPPLNSLVANAPLDKATEPIAFNGEYLLLEVTSRSPVEADQLVAAIFANSEAALGTHLTGLLSGAVVQVNSQYGSWTSLKGLNRVLAPKPPPATIVPNDAANLGVYGKTTTTSTPTGSTAGG